MHRVLSLLVGLVLAAPLAAQTLPGRALESFHLAVDDLAFIENRGQWPDEVAFLARMDGADVWITSSGLVYDVYEYDVYEREISAGDYPPPGGARPDQAGRGRVVRARFVGGRAARVEGRGKRPSYHNYLLGSDPAQWATNVPLYDEVVLHDLYDGVALRLYASEGILRQELVLAPEADADQVQVEIEGAEGLGVLGTGPIGRAEVLGVPEERPRSPASPEPRQTRDGLDRGALRLRYARFLGGTSGDFVRGIALDANNSVYLVGRTRSSNFPTPNGYDTTLQGSDDAYVAQVEADGGQAYGTYIGGSGFEEARGVAYANGSVYITGVTTSPNFPTTPGAYDGGGSGQNEDDAFVTRLRTDGSGPVFSTFLGGNGDDAGGAVAVTAAGTVVVGGRTYADDFPAPNGAYDNKGDAFVIVLSGDGASIQGGTFLGGKKLDEVRALELGNGSIYVAGETDSNDFAGLGGNFAGGTDAFVVRLSGDGNSMLGGTYIGGSGFEGAVGTRDDQRTGDIALAVGGGGTVYVAGGTASGDFPATTTIGPLGDTDAFVTRLAPDATSILGSTVFGGGGVDRARGIDVAPDGTIHVAGETSSTNFPTQNADDDTYNGLGDAFVVQLASDGGGLVYGTYLGGSDVDAAFDLVIGTDEVAYVAGETRSGGTFPVTITPPAHAGQEDAFVAAYGPSSNTAPTVEAPIPDASLVAGESPLVIDLGSVFDDADGDALTYTCQSSAPGVAAVGNCAGGTLTVTPTGEGNATVTVTATDPDGESVQDAFVVTVIDENDPPVVDNAIPNATLFLGASPLVVPLAPVFTDPDGDALTYSCQSSASGVASVSGCASGTLTVTAVSEGTATITVTATDPDGASVQDAFVVTVVDENDPPVVENPIPDTALALEGVPFVVELSDVFADADGDVLTYTCQSSAPAVAAVSGCADGVLTVTPVGVGTATITVTATDPDGASVQDAFVATVVTDNLPPVVVDPLEDLTLFLDGAPFTANLAEVFSDANGDALTYSCSASAPGVAAVGDCASGTLTVTPLDEGTITVTVTATDPDGASAQDAFVVSVVNPPPVVERPIPDFALLLGGQPYEVDLDTVFVDPNGDGLAFSFGVDSDAVSLALNGSVLIVTPSKLGVATVTVTAGDGSGSVSDAFVVTVTDNLPPVVVSPPSDVELLLGGASLSVPLAGIFSDPEGDALAYTCQSSAPGTAAADDCSDGVLTVTPVSEGSATITITATDERNAGVPVSFVVTVVDDNRPPTVEAPIPDTTLGLNESPLVIELSEVFGDGDGDVLAYTCESSAPGIAAADDCADGTLTVTPAGEGVATLTVTATDPGGKAATDAFAVEVVANAPPVLANPIANLSLTPGDVPVVLDLSEVFTDPEGDTLEYTCESSDATVAAADDCSGGTLTVTPVSEGQAVVTVTAADPDRASAADAFTVTVTAACDAVSIGPVSAAPSVPEAGSEITVTATVAGGEEVTLRYRQGGATAFQEVNMTRQGGVFAATIPGDAVTVRGVDYFIEAQGACDLVTQSGGFALRVRLPAGVTSPVLPTATEEAGYRLVSVPLLLEEAGAATVLNDFGPTDDEAWRLFELLPPGTTGDVPAGGTEGQWYRANPASITMAPGEAFWLIVRDGGRFNSGAGTTVAGDEPFSLDLHRGWNLVGTPFGHDVPLDRVRLVSGAPLQLQAYEGAWRNETGRMTPFRGYALFAEAEDALVVDPSLSLARPSTASPDMSQGAKGEGRGWSVHITAQMGRARDENNIALVSPGATEGRDLADWFEPPPIGDYVSVAFAPPAGGSAPLTVDARPVPEDGATWPLHVRSHDPGRVALAFDGLDDVPTGFVVWLVDEAAGTVHDLRQDQHYAVASQGPDAPVRMRLVIGTEAYAQHASGFDGTTPTAFHLAPNYPNPFQSVATIQYALPSAEHVLIEVFDVAGRRVATLVDEWLEAGYHRAVWDGRGTGGQAVLASGVYLYRLRAGSFTATRRAVLVR